MLAKQFSFKLRKDTEFFSQASKTRIHPFLVFLNISDKGFSIVVLIPKRVVALATKRNRIKRLLYQELQQHIHILEKKKMNCVLVLRSPLHETEISGAVQRIRNYIESI